MSGGWGPSTLPSRRDVKGEKTKGGKKECNSSGEGKNSAKGFR